MAQHAPLQAPPLAPRLRRGLAAGGASLLLWGAVDQAMRPLSPHLAERKYAPLSAGPWQALQLWGTSHVVHGLRPSAFDRRFYNFGFHSSHPSFYLSWYRMWRRHRPAPRLVLWGWDSFLTTRLPESRHFTQDSGAWPWGEVLAWAWAQPGDKRFWHNLSPLLRHREILQDRLARHPRAEDFADPGAYEAGFFPYDRPYPQGGGPLPPPGWQARLEAWRSPWPGIEVRHDPAFRRDLERLLAALDADRVRLVVFQPPYHRRLSAAEEGMNAEWRALLARRGQAFHDFNGPLRSGINRTGAFYSDATHLNRHGASYFSHFLGAYLRAQGAL